MHASKHNICIKKYSWTEYKIYCLTHCTHTVHFFHTLTRANSSHRHLHTFTNKNLYRVNLFLFHLKYLNHRRIFHGKWSIATLSSLLSSLPLSSALIFSLFLSSSIPQDTGLEGEFTYMAMM